jgi:hypothetical protein
VAAAAAEVAAAAAQEEVAIVVAVAATTEVEAGDEVTSDREVAVVMAIRKVDAEHRWPSAVAHRATAVVA